MKQGLNWVVRIVLVAIPVVASAASTTTADTAYVNGRIYTQNAKRSWADSVAVKDGKFIAVGSEKEVKRYIGKNTRVVDLHGQMAMPGVIDGHGHYVRGTIRQLFNCDFPGNTAAEDIPSKVKECVAKVGSGTWIVGGAWASAYADNGKVHKSKLDAVAPDNPVYLLDDTGHNGYVNSKALAVLGFTKEAAAKNQAFVKDKDGEPTGVLLEEAAGEATKKIPPMGDDKYQAAARKAVQDASTFGITTFVEARTDRPTVRAYHDVDQAGGLDANVVTFLQYDTDFNESQEIQAETLKDRARYRSPHVFTNFAKLYLDGVPPLLTGALLEPYEEAILEKKHMSRDYRGEMRMKPERINQDLVMMDKAGITVKMHATGDASVRAALDAIEAARKANGNSRLPHSIAHVGLVTDQDMSRFKKLGAVADIAPPLWIPGPYSKVLVDTIGQKRYDHTAPTADLLKAGATIAYGSDWPSISNSINPWPHLQSLVDRKIGHDQSIPLNSAIDTLTRGAADSIKMMDKIGSIESGKSADLIVLDKNLFKIPISDIGNTKVLLTVFQGKEVYRSNAASLNDKP